MASSQRRPIAFVWQTRLEDFISSLAWSPDGRHLAAASVSGQLGIYDSETGRAAQLIDRAHADGLDAVAWRPDGQALATAGRDGMWRLWDPLEGKQIIEHEAGALWPEHLAWSPVQLDASGHWLVVGAGNRVSFWNEKGEPMGEPVKFPRTVADLEWQPDGKTVAVAMSSGVSYHDPLTAKEQRSFAAKDAILHMALSPSGEWIMTGNQDCSVHVWNTESGGEMHMRGYAAKVRQLAWHRGSRWFAAGGGPSACVWDCSGRGPEGRTPILLEWHTEPVSALHYQPQGDWLASGSRDGGVAIWSPTQRQTLITAGKLSDGITQLAWAPRGRQLAAATETGEIQLLAVE